MKAVCFFLFLFLLPLSAHPPYVVDTSIRPLIILDPGHGGYDEGSKVHAFKEKTLSLTTALCTRKCLTDMGYRVILTRSRDLYLSLNARVQLANKNKGALFVSIHYNAAHNKEAKGIEVFYYQKGAAARVRSSRRLANDILYHLIDETGAPTRGVKVGNHHVTRETEMPAVLIEAGFITNAQERKQLQSRGYIEKIAKGIALGIDKYIEEERPRRESNARPAA